MAALVALSALIAVGVASRFWTRTPARPSGPVVLISIDTLRADHLPVYGYRAVRTPTIDALAADGIVFEHAYAHSPQTLPSHLSILSGRLPFEHGVRDNIGFVVRPDEVLLPTMLHEAGFATGGFVSAYVLRDETGIAHGFDHFDARLPPSSPEIAVGELQRDGTATLAAADAWLDGLGSPHFFLFFHLYEPHSPYAPPSRFGEYAPYDGEIAYADEIVGGLVASLKRRGLYDDALIVLLSDHGEGLGDHGEQEHGLFLYRETITVPLVVKLPQEQNAGRRVATPVQHIDVVPTILDTLKLPARPGLRGRSLHALFTGGTIPEQGLYAEALYSRYHFGWSELFALTDDRYSYIRAPRDELYDLQQDAGERRNVASERESTRVAMRNALEHLTSGAAIDAPSDVSPDARERLRALGYVGMAPHATGSSATALPDPKDKVQVLERYRAAIALVRRGKFDDALSNFQGIVKDNPMMADVWSEIGGLTLRLGRPREALVAYKRLVEVAPHDPAALISVADTLLMLGRLDEARAQAAVAAETAGAGDTRWRAQAHRALAMIALARHDEGDARAEAQRAREIDPALPMPQFVEGLLRYNHGQFDLAVPFLAGALKASGASLIQVPELRYYLGDALARLERYSDAEPVLDDEIRLFPHDLRARAALAMLYRATGRADASDRVVSEILRVAPTAEGRTLAEKLRGMFRNR
ncbi:MAG: sulfatase-like hydrolase/transferase [Acidobacteria bacterium]|nr:sulfatase-like hydrolase/transferase [Acidobacteriota bacterium]